MTLSYEGITLRAVEPGDLELFFLWENNESLWSHSNTLVPFSKFTLKRYIDNSHKSIYETGQLRLMIDLKDKTKTIGTVDLFDFDHYHSRAGLGILIAEEEYRHKGYASMAMTCTIKYAFMTLRLHQLWCNILESNKESLALFERHGFNVCGQKREWVKDGKGYSNELMLQLINNL
jgi:diamine N-acetyltransferase